MKCVFKLWVIKLHDKRTGRITVETGYERGIPLLFRTKKDANEFRKNFSVPTAAPVRAQVSVEEITQLIEE